MFCEYFCYLLDFYPGCCIQNIDLDGGLLKNALDFQDHIDHKMDQPWIPQEVRNVSYALCLDRPLWRSSHLLYNDLSYRNLVGWFPKYSQDLLSIPLLSKTKIPEDSIHLHKSSRILKVGMEIPCTP